MSKLDLKNCSCIRCHHAYSIVFICIARDMQELILKKQEKNEHNLMEVSVVLVNIIDLMSAALGVISYWFLFSGDTEGICEVESND